MGSQRYFRALKRQAPLLIVLALAIILTAYLTFEILVGAFVNSSWRSGPLVSALMEFTHDVTDTIASWGYLGLFGIMVLEASSLPIPSEVILPFSGFLVSKGILNLWLTIAVASIGAIVGSLIDYWIGLKGYQAVVKYRLLGRTIVSKSQLQTAVNWFTRYGALIVFVARLVPVFRTLISFPAGAVKMPLVKFVAYTAAGCVIWNIFLIYIGYYLGSKWAEVAEIAHYLVIGVVIGVVVLGAYLIVRWKRKTAAGKSAYIA